MTEKEALTTALETLAIETHRLQDTYYDRRFGWSNGAMQKRHNRLTESKNVISKLIEGLKNESIKITPCSTALDTRNDAMCD